MVCLTWTQEYRLCLLGCGQAHWSTEHCVCWAGDRVQGVDLMSGIMKVLLCPLFTDEERRSLKDVSMLITFPRPHIGWRLGQGLHLIPKPELPDGGRSQHKAPSPLNPEASLRGRGTRSLHPPWPSAFGKEFRHTVILDLRDWIHT